MACGVYIAGWILCNHHLHTSEECIMTYSQRQLIPIPLQWQQTTTSSQPHYYGLYKFIDARDPRPHHQHMLREWYHVLGKDERLATQKYLETKNKHVQVDDDNTYCGQHRNTTTAVLYIPGHWGSYMQSRSIGAHGIQLTGRGDYHQAQRVKRALQDHTWSGSSATTIQEFTFDVYAVDFQEEGAALHAQFLLSQTAFVARVVEQLGVRIICDFDIF
jgi:hypothetical protein